MQCFSLEAPKEIGDSLVLAHRPEEEHMRAGSTHCCTMGEQRLLPQSGSIAEKREVAE